VRKAFVALLLVGVVAVGAMAWSSMSGGPIDVRPPAVEVDTPALRATKARIGMVDCEPGTGAPVAGGLPELSLACLGGGPEVELASLRGPMVINFWASWCDPCRKEMPALEEFHEQYGERVRVLGVDVNDLFPDRALRLADETGATYPSLADPGGDVFGHEVLNFVASGLPAFVYLDESGKVVGSSSGGVESVEEIRANVSTHLGIIL
jgi:thiol-disulfide isomerase/thioredoxin